MATKGKVSPSPKEKKVMSSPSPSSSSSTPARKTNSINQRKSPGTSKQTSPVKKRQDSSSSTSPAKTRSIPNYLKPTISSGPQPPDHNNKLKKTSTNFSSTSSSNNSNSSNIGKLNYARRRSFDRPLPSTTPSQSQKTRTSPTLKERRSSSFTTRSPLPHADTRPPLKLTNKGSSSPANSSQGKMTNKKSEETGGATKQHEITKTNSNDLLNTGDEILNLDDQLQVDQLDLSSTTIITTSNDLLDIGDEILNLDHQLQDQHPNSSSTTIIDHQLQDDHPNSPSSTITDHPLQDEHPNSSSITTITDNQLKDDHPNSSSTTITDHQLQDVHPNSSSTTITDHQQVLDDVHGHDPDPNSTVITNSSTVEDMDVDRRDVINVVEQKQEKEEEKEKEVEVAGNHEVVDEEVTVAESSSSMGGDKQEPDTDYNETENSYDHDVTTLSTQTMIENADEVILEQAEPKEENIAESAGPEEQEHEQDMVHKEGAENNEEESIEKAAEMEHVAVENEDEMKKKQQEQKQQEIIQGKKESNSVSNDVIEETATKLREQRKNKVKALAGAFETVISLQDPK